MRQRARMSVDVDENRIVVVIPRFTGQRVDAVDLGILSGHVHGDLHGMLKALNRKGLVISFCDSAAADAQRQHKRGGDRPFAHQMQNKHLHMK